MLRRLSRGAALVAALAAVLAITSLSPVSASAGAQPGPASVASASVPGLGARQAALYPVERTLPLAIQNSCTAVRRDLVRLAREGLRRIACDSPAPPPMSQGTLAPAASSLCQAGEVVRTRHASCAITAVEYEVIQLPSGDVLGTGTIAFGYTETLSARSRTWRLLVAIQLAEATGVVIDDTTAITAISCGGGCTASAPWTRLLVLGRTYLHTFTIHAPGARTVTTSQSPVLQVLNPAATDQAPPVTFTSLGPARCDTDPSLKQFGRLTSGCVFKDVAATYLVYLSGKGEDHVAKNIQTGQRTKSLHFGWFGHGRPLVKAPSAIQTKNRRAACGKTHYVRPYSCDEYPFAATYQGAYFFPRQNVTMKVLGTENFTEGGRRSAMYVSERLLYGDKYWVFVVS